MGQIYLPFCLSSYFHIRYNFLIACKNSHNLHSLCNVNWQQLSFRGIVSPPYLLLWPIECGRSNILPAPSLSFRRFLYAFFLLPRTLLTFMWISLVQLAWWHDTSCLGVPPCPTWQRTICWTHEWGHLRPANSQLTSQQLTADKWVISTETKRIAS